jgi:hypothetical protein
MSPAHFAPASLAHATIPLRQLPAAAFPAAAYAFPLTPFGIPGLPGWLPVWGPLPGLVWAEPKDGARDSPAGKMMLLAENVGNFPLNTLRPGHAVGKPGRLLP